MSYGMRKRFYANNQQISIMEWIEIKKKSSSLHGKIISVEKRWEISWKSSFCSTANRFTAGTFLVSERAEIIQNDFIRKMI